MGERQLPHQTLGVSSPAQQSLLAASAPAPQASAEERFSIPLGYDRTSIVLMVKDPSWIYAYWEVRPEDERAARRHLLPHEIPGLQTILRVYDVTGLDFPAHPAHHAFDISLSALATNWYIDTGVLHRSFIVDIGLLTSTGRFLLLARSNRVTTPRNAPSDVLDEAWMTTDEVYWKLFGASPGPGSSPTAWGRLMSRQLSSGGWSSMGFAGPARPVGVKGFWCRAETDLIIHGSTEPRAKVTIQGQPVAVRRDGTFSLRVALPVGTQTITIDATSPDGRHTRTVTPIITLAWSGSLGSQGGRGSSSDAREPDASPSASSP